MLNARTLKRPTTVGLALSVVLACLSTGAAALSAASEERLVAIGDIHGAYDAFVDILQEAGLIDEELRWIGGTATLVQTGDYMDRGPKVRDVMDLLMALEQQAPEHGGRVHVLLGNHEVMSMIQEFRDKALETFEAFAGEDVEARQEEAYEAHMELAKRRARDLHLPNPVFTPESKAQWMQTHRLGFLDVLDAIGPDGKYGKWLRERQTVVKIGDTIFLHGGISPDMAAWSPEQINERVHEELETFDSFKEYMVSKKRILPFYTFNEIIAAANADVEAYIAARGNNSSTVRPIAPQHVRRLDEFMKLNSWLTINSEGPLWFRGYGFWSQQQGEAEMPDILEQYDAKQVVVAHTTRPGSILARFSNQVFLIDTGMLSSHYRGGRASALEIDQGKFTAIYPGGERVLLVDPENPGTIPSQQLPVSDQARRP